MSKSMDKNSFLLHEKHKEIFAALSKGDAGTLILAVFEYEETGAEPEFTGALKFAWIPIRQWLDDQRIKYEDTCKKRAEAGKKGGRPPKQKENKESKKTKRFLEKAKKADNESDSDSDSVSEFEDEKEEQDYGTTSREEISLEQIKALKLLRDKYIELFRSRKETKSKVSDFVYDMQQLYGDAAVYEAMITTSKVKKPPDNPMAYIKKVLADWKSAGTHYFKDQLYRESVAR